MAGVRFEKLKTLCKEALEAGDEERASRLLVEMHQEFDEHVDQLAWMEARSELLKPYFVEPGDTTRDAIVRAKAAQDHAAVRAGEELCRGMPIEEEEDDTDEDAWYRAAMEAAIEECGGRDKANPEVVLQRLFEKIDAMPEREQIRERIANRQLVRVLGSVRRYAPEMWDLLQQSRGTDRRPDVVKEAIRVGSEILDAEEKVEEEGPKILSEHGGKMSQDKLVQEIVERTGLACDRVELILSRGYL